MDGGSIGPTVLNFSPPYSNDTLVADPKFGGRAFGAAAVPLITSSSKKIEHCKKKRKKMGCVLTTTTIPVISRTKPSIPPEESFLNMSTAKSCDGSNTRIEPEQQDIPSQHNDDNNIQYEDTSTTRLLINSSSIESILGYDHHYKRMLPSLWTEEVPTLITVPKQNRISTPGTSCGGFLPLSFSFVSKMHDENDSYFENNEYERMVEEEEEDAWGLFIPFE